MVKEIVKNADVFNSMPCSLNVLKKKLDIIKNECKKQKKNLKVGLNFSGVKLKKKQDEN